MDEVTDSSTQQAAQFISNVSREVLAALVTEARSAARARGLAQDSREARPLCIGDCQSSAVSLEVRNFRQGFAMAMLKGGKSHQSDSFYL